jgi:N-formylglutamate deformylase
VIFHIPHSSRDVPEKLSDQFVLSPDELSIELLLMTDAFTDELFDLPGATVVRFPLSRLVVDVERFPDDAEEPMIRVGMGMIYTRTAAGRDLKRRLTAYETGALRAFYDRHHRALLHEVEAELATTGSALIVDCHSFPSHPLPCDQDQEIPRPDFCIGSDPFHTPEALTRRTVTALETLGYGVRVNRPYEGTLVPLPFWNKDGRVASIMIEMNRSLYMDEATGRKTAGFAPLKERLAGVLSSLPVLAKPLAVER